MLKTNYVLLVLGILTLGLTSCANQPTNYQVDPEIQFYGAQKVNDKTVAIRVLPPEVSTESNNEYAVIKPDNNFEDAIKNNLIDALIKQGYKISSNKFFTDFNVELDFTKFNVRVTKGSIKQTISVDGQLAITLKRKPHSISKSFSRSQELTVALKANQAEITGVANEVAGKLLQTAFNDKSVISFMNNMQ
ncbi:YajG family lipoprotein [Pleionea sediminis]|uniref:YajG family lipoprotein n=1 Tax=Pleionea sediminis TaxID=2569479 RepID=UPI0013DE6C85|nr:YajG family lipoprotein [Pleionea sediminis]